ncbi:hypothetical protein SSOG_09160 [Streptomyces himastatinicus ATCC 53653]|uniref:Uncharacterized protein n=1 Tax=Streptomyces himastatinicus ATCC 53653 TaxID=457427 RepID=D9WX18_9ACTN|nr:hypothetical protein SSOG_09160 [Streptomyces himastatinicus ATCC 53653]
MPAREKSASIVCTRCKWSALLPEDRDHSELWDAGWRWRGDPAERPLRFAPHAFVYSCPDCPPVLS